MNALTYGFAAMLLLIGLLGGIGICTPRKLWMKAAALGVVNIVLVVLFLSS